MVPDRLRSQYAVVIINVFYYLSGKVFDLWLTLLHKEGEFRLRAIQVCL